MVLEVILSNQKKPSIPAIILETIINIVNGAIDDEAPVSSEQSSTISNDVLSPVASSIVEDIIDEVIQSNNRQPSIPSVVLQLIMEMITKTDNNNNKDQQTSQSTNMVAATATAATATAATATLPQDEVDKQPKQTAGDKKVKKFGPSEAEQQKNAVHVEPMAKVCNLLVKKYAVNKINTVQELLLFSSVLTSTPF